MTGDLLPEPSRWLADQESAAARSLVGLGLRNPGLAEAILSTAPPRWAPVPAPEPSGFSARHESLGRLLYCPVEDALLDPTQPAPAPVRCPICGPVTIEGGSS